MPYFSIAYIHPESECCASILVQAESKEAAEKEFKAKTPEFKFVSCWERPDFKPAKLPKEKIPASCPAPCKCGNKNIGLVHGVPSGRVYALCISCGRRTGIKISETEACRAWNTGTVITPRLRKRKRRC